MLDTSCWDPYKLEYNEELKRWDLYVNDDVIASGGFHHCLDFMYAYLCNTDPDTKDNSEEVNEGLVNEFLYCREQDADLDVYMLGERIESAQEEAIAADIALQFAVDVLDIMRTGLIELLSADTLERDQIKVDAYDKIQELIDHTSEKMKKRDLI